MAEKMHAIRLDRIILLEQVISLMHARLKISLIFFSIGIDLGRWFCIPGLGVKTPPGDRY